MLSRRPTRSRRLIAAALVASFVAFSQAAVAGGGPFRVRIKNLPEWWGPTVPPIALSTTSCLLLMVGYDGGNDVYVGAALLVEKLDGEPTITPLPLPEGVRPLSDDLGLDSTTAVRLSATRVLAAHSGPDGDSSTGDEGVLLIDDLGGENTVQDIPIGTLSSPNIVALDERTAAVEANGGMVLIRDLGGANQVTPIPGAGWSELAFSSTGFLATGDSESGWVHVKLGEGAPELVPLPSAGWQTALRLADDRLLLTEPEGVRLVPDVSEPDESVLVPLPGISDVVRTGPDRAIGRVGDSVVMIDDLGRRNRVKTIRVPGMDPGTLGAPVSLGRRSAAVLVTGPAFADRGFAWVRPGAQPLFVPLFTPSWPIALSPTRLLIASSNGSFEEELMHVFELGERPRATTIEVPYAYSYAAASTVLLGNGRAVQLEPLTESPFGPVLTFLDGMPGGIVLDDVALDVAGPTVKLRARFALPEPKTFGEADLRLRIGAVQQRIPADAIRPTSRGFRYRDPAGANGFFRLVDYDAKKKRLRVEGRSTEAQAPLGANRVVALESTEFYAASASPEVVE